MVASLSEELVRSKSRLRLDVRLFKKDQYFVASQSKKYVVPSTLKGFIYAGRKENLRQSFKRNDFAVQSLLAIGGGAVNKLKECFKYYRVGGSTTDKLLYLNGYVDRATIDIADLPDPQVYAGKIFGIEAIGSEVIAYFSEVVERYRVKYDTYAGCIYKTAGVGKKKDAAVHAISMYQYINYAWRHDADSSIMPSEVLEASSRPKLARYDKIRCAAEVGKPLGRVISMPSIVEQLIGYPIYDKVAALLKARLLKSDSFIAIGIRRNTDDWVKLGNIIEKYSVTYEGDWSKYDQTIPRVLVDYALDIILSLFRKDDPHTANYLGNFKRWYMGQMVEKFYLIDSRVVAKVDNGIASGSLFTSILGSVINFVVLNEMCNRMGVFDASIIVYGDDHLINTNTDIFERDGFKEEFSSIAEQLFGMNLDPGELKVTRGDDRFVQYERPVYKPGAYLAKGTRGLKPVRIEVSHKPFFGWDHSVGTTHRFQYRFQKAVSFLKYFFLIDTKKPIRPLIDTLVRIVNPERKPRGLGEHMGLLLAHLGDNRNNMHVRNYVYQMYYDAMSMNRLVNPEATHVLPQFNLMNKGSPYVRSYYEGPVKAGDRMWFRRMAIEGAFEDDPRLSLYNDVFDMLVRKVLGSESVLDGLEHYEVADIFQILRDRGINNPGPSDLFRLKKIDPAILDRNRVSLEDWRLTVAKATNEMLLETFGVSNYLALSDFNRIELSLLNLYMRNNAY
ncbi:MAG: RNA-dependent RNA polymerase [Sanya amalgavirus 1]|nr:MAG: RNA-dependent RNA polymerase [Sanya amalgavirus 1]